MHSISLINWIETISNIIWSFQNHVNSTIHEDHQSHSYSYSWLLRFVHESICCGSLLWNLKCINKCPLNCWKNRINFLLRLLRFLDWYWYFSLCDGRDICCTKYIFRTNYTIAFSRLTEINLFYTEPKKFYNWRFPPAGIFIQAYVIPMIVLLGAFIYTN